MPERAYELLAPLAEQPPAPIFPPVTVANVAGMVLQNAVAGAGLSIVAGAFAWAAGAWEPAFPFAACAGVAFFGLLCVVRGARDEAQLVRIVLSYRKAREQAAEAVETAQEADSRYAAALRELAEARRLLAAQNARLAEQVGPAQAWVAPVAPSAEADAKELARRRYVNGEPVSKRYMEQFHWPESRYSAAVQVLKRHGVIVGNNWASVDVPAVRTAILEILQ